MSENQEPTNWLKTLNRELIINQASRVARVFDKNSTQWQGTIEINTMFIRANEHYANDCLKLRGHIFLNEIYDMLGMPRSAVGAILGWACDSENSDGYIEFEVQVLDNDSILIDFNVDGVIVGNLVV